MKLNCKIIFTLSSLLSIEHFTLSKSLTILSFNIDTNIGRTEEGYAREAFPELRVNARMPKLIATLANIIDEEYPDVIQLQEGRSFITKYGDKVDSITPLINFLKEQGYQVKDAQYNPSDRAFSYIEAIKPTFTVDHEYSLYFTKTPHKPTDHSNHAADLTNIKAHNYGEEWERSAYITQFHNKAGQVFYAFNVHLGIVPEHRLKACEQLKEWSAEIITKNPKAKIIITGDFNTFPQWLGPDQLKIMNTNSILQEVTQELFLPNMQPTDVTFISFPPDFAANEQRLRSEVLKLPALNPVTRREKIIELFKTECQALGGHLDRVFQYGFKSAIAMMIPTPQFEDFEIDEFSEGYVKEFILRHIDDGPAFASDHQPILTQLQF